MRALVAFTAALVVGVVVLIGYVVWYEVNDPGHGRITEKKYRPAYTSTQCHQVGKTTVCTPVTHPECYEVRYTDGKHDGDACVSPKEYELYQVGGMYPVGAS